MKPAIALLGYEEAASRVHDRVVQITSVLPNASGLTPELLAAAAEEYDSIYDVLTVVRLFQCVPSGLAVNVAFFAGS